MGRKGKSPWVYRGRQKSWLLPKVLLYIYDQDVINMMPGKMNSREMKRMMAQMGIKSTDMPDVKTVILKGSTKDYIISDAQVMMIEAQGQKTFQIIGNMKEMQKSETTAPQAPQFPDEDIKIVMEQAGVTKDAAIDALKKAGGEPAKAIMDLLQQ